MTFSNPAGNAAVAASGYVQALLEVLGPREPLGVLQELIPGSAIESRPWMRLACAARKLLASGRSSRSFSISPTAMSSWAFASG